MDRKRAEAILVYKALGVYFVTSILIITLWQFYEERLYGEVMYDRFDSLIAILFSLSITFNYILWHDLKEQKSK